MRRVSSALCAVAMLGALAMWAGAQEPAGPAPGGSGGPEAGGPGGPGGPDGPGGPGGRGPRGGPVMRALDADSNGEISAEELDNAVAALKALDANADGKLAGDEVRPPRREGGDRPDGVRGQGPGDGDDDDRDGRGAGGNRPNPEQFADMMLRNDTDGDGKLSREELIKGVENFGQRRNRGDGDRPDGGDRPEGGPDRPEGGPDRPE